MFDKIKELLEAGKISQEVAQELDTEVSKALKELRDENAKHRAKAKELSQALEEVTGSKEELQKQLESLDERIAKAKEEGKQELAQQLEAERTEKDKLKATLEDIEARNRELTVDNAIGGALGKFDVIDSEVVAAVLKGAVEVGESGVMYREGDALLPLDEGVKKFFEAKPHLLKSTGQNGSGANGGGASFVGKKKSEMNAAQKAEFIKQNGQEAYLSLEE